MTHDNALASTVEHEETMDTLVEDEFESLGDYHRMAAHHFEAAAKHHLAAAEADEQGDDLLREQHAYRAYRHQLNGIQYAEIAAMDSDDEDSAD